jgi:hypothetical protein
MEFHCYIPGGLEADARIFTFDPRRECWEERRSSMTLYDPDTN